MTWQADEKPHSLYKWLTRKQNAYVDDFSQRF